MKHKILLFILIAFIMALLATSCGNSIGGKIDVDGFREKMRDYRKQESISQDQKEAAKKSIFPKLKSKE